MFRDYRLCTISKTLYELDSCLLTSHSGGGNTVVIARPTGRGKTEL
jgi:hypothetical protein